MDKVFPSAEEAVADIADSSSIAVGGFGLAGIPAFLIEALPAYGATDLTIVSNNCGIDGAGLGPAPRRAPDQPSDQLVGRREPRVRSALPRGRDPARAHAPRNAGRTAARRRGRHPGVLHRHRYAPDGSICDGLSSEGHPCVRWPRVPAGAGRPKRSVPGWSRRCDAQPETSRRGWARCVSPSSSCSNSSNTMDPDRNDPLRSAPLGRLQPPAGRGSLQWV